MVPNEFRHQPYESISILLETLKNDMWDCANENMHPTYENQCLGRMIPSEFLSYTNRYNRLTEKKLDLPDLDADTLVDLMLQHWFLAYETRAPYSKTRLNQTEKNSLLSYLKDCGYDFPEKSLSTLIALVRSTLTIRKEFENARHMALNNYDFDRLLSEVSQLKARYGSDVLVRFCPVFNEIIEETIISQNNDYPGRHLPYRHLKGKKSKQYKLLRFLDEIMYTSPTALRDDEIKSEIRSAGFTFKIQRHDLAHAFSILSDLISVEFDGGCRVPYSRNVYRQGVRGHTYRPLEDDTTKRATAFMMTISREEYLKISKEVKMMETEIDLSPFPLLASFSYDKFENWIQKEDEYLNEVTNSTLFTVKYRPSEYSELLGKVKKIIELQQFVCIQKERGWELYEPIEIKRDGDSWGLLAIKADRLHHDNNSYYMLTPAQLMQSIENKAINKKSDITPACIGISPLYDNNPHSILLKLTKEGISYLKNIDAFSNIELPHFDFTVLIEQTFFDVEIRVLLNNDFFKLLYNMDCQNFLGGIEPDEICRQYESYYVCVAGKEHKPWRPEDNNTFIE